MSSLTYNLGTRRFPTMLSGSRSYTVEVAIHTILYVRQVYPADLFVRRKKYETPVYQSRHPGLNEYITGAVRAMNDELALGSVEKVVVVIKDKDEVALERFIFSIQNMIASRVIQQGHKVLWPTTSLGQYFRSFMVKLNMIESQLAELPRDGENTFAIVMELREGEAPSTTPHKDDPPPWIPATTQHTTSGASEKAELHMVRAVDTGVVNLSLAVQESAHKLRILAELNSSTNVEQIQVQES
ncbi:DNA-binding protein [Lactarius akahatsu]|uniref:DNA-binding protein n=1 Tax=Lactarius akahatsu TaxID=416441 RepID=A0AAD4QAW2_9AGAM|nr:DNA-binding protein [Lactarius akahatsu]